MFNTVRNYLAEKTNNLLLQMQAFQRSQSHPDDPDLLVNDSDLRRHEQSFRDHPTELRRVKEYQQNYDQIVSSLDQKNALKDQHFEFFSPSDPTSFPADRLPAPGIQILPLRYHSTNPVIATNLVPETGFPLHPLIHYLVYRKYPRYIPYVEKYVRPLGTTDATFSDFNREQVKIAPLDPERKRTVLTLCKHFLACVPYLPIHFVDFMYAKLPLHTGTGYFNRFSYDAQAHASFAHPEQYHDRHTSKGYYINTTMQYARTIVHRLKQFALPFNPKDFDSSSIFSRMRFFFLTRPTMLFTRNHISDRDGNLKQRPVYAVDDLFLILEVMLTFPLLVMARLPECCIMYGLETIRGSNHWIDSTAKRFRSYFTIDWSQYDQRLPRCITDLYYTDFLESLIIINFGYQPTADYADYPDLTPDMMFTRMTNLLHFLHTWYNNMVYVTADGFAYIRKFCGVPSGLFNTQYLDSFGNLYLIIDGMLEFGISIDEITSVLLLIMGDDNSGFTHWELLRLTHFLDFFENYALVRYNMVLSKSKSVITRFRNRIETLSYSANFGMPTRPLGKLVAQLCYPEHGVIDKYMSSRAIGIAYAAAGMDPSFHRFCEDVYLTFLPYAAPIDSSSLERIIKHLPGQFKMLDAYTDHVNLESFPSIHEVRLKYSKWQGPLDLDSKWNPAHFTSPPNLPPQGFFTIEDWRTLHNIPRPPVTDYFP
uniref:RNA-dependent RNA polymerase n=1 Tax=Helicobasidium mompa partitivirus V1-1 TaxID=233049 RepID=Q6BE43_9VIRU|nr:RNA-dependent RNA polymerase [Helicobasidium mompa partitivirus V1-1]